MKVLISARKTAGGADETNAHASAASEDIVRTPFIEVLRTATLLILVLPRVPGTVGLISTQELALMRPDAVVVNVARGGIVDERAIVAALSKRQIHGYATDVFEQEPASSETDSALFAAEARGLNLVLSPHLAWSSDLTKVNIRRTLQENVRHWLEGRDSNRVV